jgi:hypothetical protein
MAVLFCSLQGYAQFWISFGWNEPHCQNCLWMEQAIRMTNRQAAEYHKIIHRYGEKIEREARKHYRYWDQSAQKIYKLRMERDRKLQRILSPSQFRLYVRFVRETPTRIHDWRGWYNNPHYPDYRPSSSCHRYEDHYWHCQWEYTNNRWFDRFDDGKWYPGKYDRPGHDNGQWRPDKYDRPQPSHNNGRPHHDNGQWKPDKYDRPHHQGGRPGSDHHKNKHDKDKYDKKRPDRDKDRHYDKNKKGDKRSDKDRTNSRQRTSDRRSIEKSI